MTGDNQRGPAASTLASVPWVPWGQTPTAWLVQ